MGSADIFCLQWNTTIRSNLREIRETSEFFDVTLCCDNGVDTVKAHKVIMAACSPLFRRILVQNNHQNPFLLLKGIHFKELQNVLNSMYYGEVSIAQDSLNKFLTVAEELAVKGLTTMDTNHIPTTFYNGNDSIDTPPKQSSSALKTKNSVNTSKRKIDPDLIDKSWLEVDLKRIKAKPEKDTRQELGFDDDDDLDDSTACESEQGASSTNNPDKDYAIEEARFARTQRGNPLLFDSLGHSYKMKKKKPNSLVWVCQHATKYRCSGTLVTVGFHITRKSVTHNHPPLVPKKNKFT